MRRALLSVFGIMALSLASPGAALARHHHHHHKSRAHHARVRFEHVGVNGVSPQPGPMSKDEPTSPEPPTMAEGAGKIASFTEGVLTIALNDGSSVSGKVTSATEIRCEKAETSPTPSEGDKESEDGMRTREDSTGESSEDKDEEGTGDKGDEGDDNGSGDDGTEGASEPPCDASALTPGTVVREAELRVSSTGAEFESVDIVR